MGKGKFTRMLDEIMKLENSGFDVTTQSYFSAMDKSMFENDGDDKKDGDGVGRTWERASGDLAQARSNELGYSGEENAPHMTVDQIISGMEELGYEKADNSREDKWQQGYTPSQDEVRLFNEYETKDIQAYIESLGYDLNDFGEDNIFGFETGAVVSRFTTPSVDTVDPKDIRLDENLDFDIKKDPEMQRVFHYEPSNDQWYSAEPNTKNRKTNQETFVQMNEKQILGWGEQLGVTKGRMKELEEQGGKEAVMNALNNKQKISNGMKKAYVSGGKFPIYKSLGRHGQEKAYDADGNLILTGNKKLRTGV